MKILPSVYQLIGMELVRYNVWYNLHTITFNEEYSCFYPKGKGHLEM